MARAEIARGIEELEDDEGFETLNAKVATGVWKITTGEFQRELELLEEKEAAEGRLLNGRQLYFLILEKLNTTDADGEVKDLEDLLTVELKGDNLRALHTEWKELFWG